MSRFRFFSLSPEGGGRQPEGPLCGPTPLSPVQVGTRVKVKWQRCKFSPTAEDPLGETKWHQPVAVAQCCRQGDDEHLSLKGRSWIFLLFESECQRETEGAGA